MQTVHRRHERKRGLAVVFYSDDLDESGNLDNLLVDEILDYDQDSGFWVGIYDENTFRHESDEGDNQTKG